MIIKANSLELSHADDILDRSEIVDGQNTTLVLLNQVDYKNVLNVALEALYRILVSIFHK